MVACGLRRVRGVSKEAWARAGGGGESWRVVLERGARHGVEEEGGRMVIRNIAVLDSVLPYLYIILDDMDIKE